MSYITWNSPMVTTAAPAKVATGTAIKTMLQLAAPSTRKLSVVGWGISFDGAALATPGVCELVQTDVGGTITQAVAAGIQPYDDDSAPASLLDISGTTKTGYTCTSEGSITATRSLDTQLIDPANGYVCWFPETKRPKVAVSKFLRVRVTFGTTTNALCYVIWDEV
ncbi:MAG TPA: hypothetical protein VH333_10065 [Pseudonocardiaceae bacterium]|jgi:hypothetical protein|nr:hypothetical protein [Pseudonocardiaceae bacterium]